MKLNGYIDLFAGIGGFALGARWAGLEFGNHYYSEIDRYAIETYKKNFPEAAALGDITKITGEELERIMPVEIVTGGFPCQDLSIAGKGAGIDGERSGLWSDMHRVIGILRPRFAIIENVPGLAFRGLDRVLANLAQIGYDAEWQNISAGEIGAPHKRERIWIVAYPSCGMLYGPMRKSNIRTESANSNKNVGDADGTRLEGFGRLLETAGKQSAWTTGAAVENERLVKSGIRPLADGLPGRVAKLRCLGKSLVPQIAQMIFTRIKELLKDESGKSGQQNTGN